MMWAMFCSNVIMRMKAEASTPPLSVIVKTVAPDAMSEKMEEFACLFS
jgi:uncharacterized membrane protein